MNIRTNSTEVLALIDFRKITIKRDAEKIAHFIARG